MSRLPVVAVVGRPNVGKSTLVNRVLRRMAAVVGGRPGVTRDRREFEADWNGRSFLLVDTGGWDIAGDTLATDVRHQAEAAVAGADVVLVVADATTLPGDDDRAVARIVQRSGLPALLVANKADGATVDPEAARLWSLGLGEPHPVSALHGRNIGDLLDAVVARLPESEGHEAAPAVPTLAIVGRPNVGKSTLLNRLAGEERVLVSPEPGTTRDPIDVVVDIDGTSYRVVDTAGIRRRSRSGGPTESWSVERARAVVEDADIVLLVIDGTGGVAHQEQRLVEAVVEAGCGLVVLLNKWDITDTEQKERTVAETADRLAFVAWAPVLRIAASTGARLDRLGAAIEFVLENRRRRIPTPELNRRIIAWQEAHPPPTRGGRRGRILYAVQVGIDPPTIVLFVRGGEIGPDYLRFLEGRLRGEYEFGGTPIRLIARRRQTREQA
ncbi:MAG TPA: ribosome biogenesis GTPase Der [Acidimicrobiia bacterium]|nr:ribosome biogenesis GTPase Der [Acidimicrobiia bacterium]